MVNLTKQKVIITSGKRKSAIARLVLKPGKGMVRVNGQMLSTYGTNLTRAKLSEPLRLAGDMANQIQVEIKVAGGGVISQVDAMRLALGRALAQFGGEKTRKILLDYDRSLLVADTRRKEVCKPNDSKARAKRQSSKR